MKLFNLPLGEETVIFGTNKEINNEEIMKLVSSNVTDFQTELVPQFQGEKIKDYDKALRIKAESTQVQIDPSQLENPWQNYISNLIEFWKEFAVSSIRMNEKMVKEFWKSFSKE